MKPIIGLVPSSRYTGNRDQDPCMDQYYFIDNYIEMINKAGGIPMGVLLDKEKVSEEVLSHFDAFIIPGGHEVNRYSYEIIDYAIKHNKPLLGICRGMHAISIYSDVIESDNVDKVDDNFFVEYKRLKELNEGSLLKRLPDLSNNHVVTYDTMDIARHDVNIIDKDSLLYSIYKQDRINIISMHNYGVRWIGKDFKVTALADDGVIEGVEYNKEGYFIVGTQWHPEHEDGAIFRRLVEEAIKRK